MFTQMLSVPVVKCLGGESRRPYKCVVASSCTGHHARSPSLVRHTYHCPIIIVIRCEDRLVQQPIQLWQTFSCLFLLSFMLTLPLHEVMTPLFFFLFLIFFVFLRMDPAFLFLLLFFFLLHFIPPTFLPLFFCWFVCFWRQQVGIDQGDIPDLSQVSVHLTFHFLFSLFPILTPFLPLSPPLFSAFPSTLHVVSLLPLRFHPSTHTLFHPYIYLFPPFPVVHTFSLLHSPPTRFYFKQPSCLTWSESRQLPSGLIDFLLCLSLLNARYRSNSRLRCVKLARLNTAPSAGPLQVSSRGFEPLSGCEQWAQTFSYKKYW